MTVYMTDAATAQLHSFSLESQRKIQDFLDKYSQQRLTSIEVTNIIDLTTEQARNGFGPACKVFFLKYAQDPDINAQGQARQRTLIVPADEIIEL